MASAETLLFITNHNNLVCFVSLYLRNGFFIKTIFTQWIKENPKSIFKLRKFTKREIFGFGFTVFFSYWKKYWMQTFTKAKKFRLFKWNLLCNQWHQRLTDTLYQHLVPNGILDSVHINYLTRLQSKARV